MGLREEYERRKREEAAEREQRTQQRMQNTPDRTSIKIENASMNEAARSAHRNERINRRTSQRNTSDSSNAVDYFNRVRAARTSNTTRKPYSVDQYNAPTSTHSIYNQTHEATPVKFDNDALFRMRMQNSPYMNTVNMFQNTPTDNVPQMSEEQINQFNSNYFNPVTSNESVYDDALSMAMQNSPYMNTMNVIQNNIQNATPYSEALAESQRLSEEERRNSQRDYSSIPLADDFEQYSQYVDTTNGMYRDELYEINRPGRHVLESTKNETDYMTDEERQIANYLYQKEGLESFNEYMDTLELSRRSTEAKVQEEQQFADEHPFWAGYESIALSPLKGAGYLEDVFNVATGQDIDQYSTAHLSSNIQSGIREEQLQNIEDGVSNEFGRAAAKFAYSTGMSIGDFLLTSAVTGGNEALSLAIMGTGAAQDSVIESKERGLDDEHALLTATCAGAAEIITEKISIEALFKEGATGTKYILQNILSEGFEEGESDVLNLLADAIINGDQSEFNQNVAEYEKEGYSHKEAVNLVWGDWAAQLGTDMLAGAVSGGVMAGGASTINSIPTMAQNNADRRTGRTVNRNSETRTEIINRGLESEDEHIRQIAQEASEGKISNKKMGELTRAVAGENSIGRAISKSFTDKGFTEESANNYTNAVVKYLSGEKLDTVEQNVIESEVGQSVLNEINEGQYDANYENTIAINDALEMARNTRKSNDRANVETEVSNPQTVTTEAENRAEIATAEAENSNENVVSEKTRPSLSQIAQVRDSQAQVQKAIEEGKNIRVNSSDVAEIVNSTEDGTTVRLNNGMEVDSSQLVFESRDMNRAYENAAKFNDKVVAENYIDSYIKASEANTNGVLTENTFNGFWNMYYEAGENAAQTFDQVTSSLNSNYKDLYNSVVAPNIAMQSAMRMAYAYGENKAARNSAVRASEEQVKAVESFAKILNANVQFTDEKNNTNGYYKDGTIYISRYADKAAVSVFSHEFTHRLKQTSTEGFNEYRDFVVNFLKKEDGRYESLIENLKKNYGELSEEDIQEELVANSTESFLFDKKFAQEVASSNKSLAKKIVNLIDTMLKEIKAAFGERESISAEAIYLESDVEALKKAKKLWLKAIRNAEVNTTENTTKNSLKASEMSSLSAEDKANYEAFSQVISDYRNNKLSTRDHMLVMDYTPEILSQVIGLDNKSIYIQNLYIKTKKLLIEGGYINE